jgi:hypothetical protein
MSIFSSENMKTYNFKIELLIYQDILWFQIPVHDLLNVVKVF